MPDPCQPIIDKLDEKQSSLNEIQSQVDTLKDDLARCRDENGGGDTGMKLIDDLYDQHARVFNSGGAGSANCVGKTDQHWVFESNYHVAGRVGNNVRLDLWAHGDFIKQVTGVVSEAYYDANRSKDISVILIPLDKITWAFPVLPHNEDFELKAGMTLFSGACMQALSPRPRRGNIVTVQNGLIYYTPPAIGGDSGSSTVMIIEGKVQTVGRTAWRTSYQGQDVGLAMTSKRIGQFKRGEASEINEMLPDGWSYPWEPQDTPNQFVGGLPPVDGNV